MELNMSPNTSMRPILAALLTILTLLGSPTAVFAGGNVSGGSCGVQRNGRWLLKDFVRSNKAPGQLSYQSGLPLTDGIVARRLGVEVLSGKHGSVNFHQTEAVRSALNRLNQWKSDSPEITIYLERAIQQIIWLGSMQIFPPVVYGCQEKGDSPIVIYDPGLQRAWLSFPMWNSIDGDSQLGVIFKEGLRFMQDQMGVSLFKGEGFTEQNEQVIANIVSTLVYGSPRAGNQSLQKMLHAGGKQFPTFNWNELNNKLQSVCREAISSLGRFESRQNALDIKAKKHWQEAVSRLQSCSSVMLSRDSEKSLDQTLDYLFDSGLDFENQQFKIELLKIQNDFASTGTRGQMSAAPLWVRRANHLLLSGVTQQNLFSFRSPEMHRSLHILSGVTTEVNDCAFNANCAPGKWEELEEISKLIYEHKVNEPNPSVERLRKYLHDLSPAGLNKNSIN